VETQFVEAAKLPEGQQDARIAAVQAGAMPQRQITVFHLLIPAFARVTASHRRAQAHMRSTAVALAVERYRLEEGHWPESLAELVPARLAAVPADPFDGKPLRYRRLADGVVVYSVGADGVDNGGRLDRKNPSANGIDIGVRLWDVARRRQPPVKPASEASPDEEPPKPEPAAAKVLDQGGNDDQGR
jgi:hypothetical protein